MKKSSSTERPTDEKIFKNPSLWPGWPRLPVKNPRVLDDHGLPRLGLLVESFSSPDSVRFVEGNMFTVTYDDIKAAPKADTDALLAAGWIVD